MLSEKIITKLIPGAQRNDRVVTGLHVRCTPKGKKCYYVQYRTRTGVQRRPKIGVFPEVPLAEARSRARAILGRVAVGEDPRGQWLTIKSEPTLDTIFQTALIEHWSAAIFKRSGWPRKIEGLYKLHIRPSFGQDKISEITPQRVKYWHKKLKSHPVTANHAKAILSKIFNLAKDRGHDVVNPTYAVKNHVINSRNRHASDKELTAIINQCYIALKDEPEASLYILTLIYTGARPRSLADVKPSDLQIFSRHGKNYGVLKFSGKSSESTGMAEILFFPPVLISLYESYGVNPLGTQYPRKLWEYIREAIGAYDLWLRDLRRTFATMGFNNGVGRGIIGELLNHKDEKTTRIYAKLHESTRLDAVDVISNSIDELIYWKQVKV